MKRIFKYSLEILDRQEVELPAGAKILSVQAQNGLPQIWAMVDDSQVKTDMVHIRIIGTGYEIPDADSLDLYAPREGCTPCAYCGKQVPNDKLVKHRIIFQGLENGKRKIKEQVMNFCSGECAMNEQCSREG